MSDFCFDPSEMPKQPVLWTDRRLVDVHHNDTALKVYIPKSIREHQKRKEEILRRVKLSAGLLPEFPLPQNPPEITNRHIYQGVAIYDVKVETLPGLKLTGNLYLPEKIKSPVPGILCPHGHWEHGRVEQSRDSNLSMRNFEFARLGFAVFAYDMLGYNDNNDLPHKFPKSMQIKGDFYGISPFGLQTANSLRAAELISSLPEVDPERIGCTGASGGGSQTWFLGLLSDKIKVLAPVCMLSSHFQGGCTCEEGPLLRTTGVTSFDIVSCLAPRPLLLPSVNGDWTIHVPDYEYPAMKQVYDLYDAADLVENINFEDFHNYNKRTCQYVYSFFLRHLALKKASIVIEEENLPPPTPELLWHGGKKPEPATAVTIRSSFEKLKHFYSAHSNPSLSEGKKILSELVSDGIPVKDAVERVLYPRWTVPGGKIFQRTVSRRDAGDWINGLRVVPGYTSETRGSGNSSCETGYLLIAPDAIRSLNEEPVFNSLAASLTKKGIPGMIMELLGSGESAEDLKHSLRIFNSPTDLAFNPSLWAMRVQDIRTVYALLRERGFKKVVILSTPGTALAALAAIALLPDADAFCDLQNLQDRVCFNKFNYQPLLGRIGGLRGLIRLAARPGVNFVNAYKYAAEIRKTHGVLCSNDFIPSVKEYRWKK